MKSLKEIQKELIKQARLLVPDCDAENPSVYWSSRQNKYICRCIVCSRCNHHTGNSNQGHYWKFCHVMAKFHNIHKTQSLLDCQECLPAFHFCCKDNCELFEENGIRKEHVNEQ